MLGLVFFQVSALNTRLAKIQIAKEYVFRVVHCQLTWLLKNKDALRKAHGSLCGKLSTYLQSLPDTQHIFSCKIMKENVEINCWFSSSNQRLGTHLLRVLIKHGYFHQLSLRHWELI